jgi:hypothetical protein
MLFISLLASTIGTWVFHRRAAALDAQAKTVTGAFYLQLAHERWIFEAQELRQASEGRLSNLTKGFHCLP